MARKGKPGQLGFNFEAEPEAPIPAPFAPPVETPLNPRDYPPWDSRYVQWFNSLSNYGRTLEQIRLDKITLRQDDAAWMKEFLEQRIKANQAWIDKEDNVPF
jgi:hypothetical protein